MSDFKNKHFPFRLSIWQLNLLVSLVFVGLFNQAFWHEINTVIAPSSYKDYLFFGSVVLLLVVLINLVLNLLVAKSTFKYVYPTLFLLSAICYYYMAQYNIVIDRDMIRNVVETNPAEAKDLFGLSLLWYLLVLFIIPSWLISKTNIKSVSWQRLFLEKSTILVGSLLAISLLIYASFPIYASLAREDRHLSHMILPTNFIFASLSYGKEQFNNIKQPFQDLSQDAHVSGLNDGKKKVIVLVVGETARADRFSLNNYERNTNPKLSKRDLVNFQNTTSCGTSTATSLPCIFSYLSRQKYNHKLGKNSSNLLDFYQAAGFDVQWRDNNTGCKGLCDRVEFVDLTDVPGDPLCDSGECFDEILLKGLREQILANNNNQLIVLHQKGSHGPAYYLRYPKAFEVFTPTCQETQLQKCSEQALNNSYDNTILYTDYVIDSTISLLESLPEDTDTSMLYISDHGESLGENNLYLHGTPYVIAPEVQTHVPFIFWSSNHDQALAEVDTRCVEMKQMTALSHDNIFHSALGLMNIHSRYYQPDLDLFAGCKLHHKMVVNSFVKDATSL
jgi:lipid A ethanolaminephosphotransferase